ncbi:TldD/PmbA family protein [Pontixanthobacter aestiaquae]|uniref:TldD/PmbA family protein n=1 Tax=Pontixanthobacter aestiaquae TaxID=1509367 RepID=A0A844Z542_9SPHN|nr:TldD/PmbA family protein [Pontixanthobacter aestiaquae]MDN3647121.1 TldD/PmbA family protein [Pontixanthobacter aestiaquae]MXO81903.1 TldD/PmbA family protein [Pontixanthobacter aestiaquae]
MITSSEAQDRCARLIELAVKAGADAADAVTAASASESVTVRLGALEDVERSEGEEIGLRVFAGKRFATTSTSDFSASGLGDLAERAVAMARLAPEDPYAGLAPEHLLATGAPRDLDVCDPAEPTPSEIKARALEAEDAARAVEGVTNSNGASAGFSRSISALVTSHGFSAGYEATSHSLSVSMIAGEGEAMQRDYDYRVARHLSDLPAAQFIGANAGERSVARLNPGFLPSGPMLVVFDPRVGGTLVSHLLGAMSGMAIARRSSFLLDRLEDDLFAKPIRIMDDPHRLRGPRSRPFDGEGLPTAPRALVENGRLTGWLLNAASAKQLELTPTGHASRGSGGSPGVAASNVHLEAGAVTRDELIADIQDGVLVNELIGQGVNGITGDYSRGASGFRIKDGKISGPVSDFTIAGNLIDMFASLTAANDLEMYRAINVPTLRVDGMTIAGE